MLRALGWIVKRDWLLALRRRADVLGTFVFFVIVVTLFPLGVGAEPQTLRAIGSGVIWVAALLACLLSLPRLFAQDLSDGSLEQLMLLPRPRFVLVAGKVMAHWLTTGLPLVLLAPLIGLQFGLSGEPLWVMSAALLIGTPILSIIGAIGAALTLGLRGAGVLIALLVLPLTVPVLVFGAGAVDLAQAELDWSGNFSLLGAGLVLAAAFGPWAIAAALSISME